MKNETYAAEQWRLLILEGETTPARKRLSRLFALLPANTRCHICKVPFSGVSGQMMRAIGKTASTLNPHMCSDCDNFIRMNPGGLEVELSMIFADIRGSTALAEGMTSTAFREMIHRFYTVSTGVLCQSDAIIDKLAGDQVSGYFIPGISGRDHARKALNAAIELLRVTGHGDPGGPWIPVGIGIHTGLAFFGTVGTAGGIVDVTALGDAVNVGARLASQAGPGEILFSQDTSLAASWDNSQLLRRDLALKGRSQPVTAFVQTL